MLLLLLSEPVLVVALVLELVVALVAVPAAVVAVEPASSRCCQALCLLLLKRDLGAELDSCCTQGWAEPEVGVTVVGLTGRGLSDDGVLYP